MSATLSKTTLTDAERLDRLEARIEKARRDTELLTAYAYGLAARPVLSRLEAAATAAGIVGEQKAPQRTALTVIEGGAS